MEKWNGARARVRCASWQCGRQHTPPVGCHVVLRHGAELECSTHSCTKWGAASLAWEIATSPATGSWALIPALAGLSYLRVHILNDPSSGKLSLGRHCCNSGWLSPDRSCQQLA